MINNKLKWLLMLLFMGMAHLCLAQQSVKSLIVELNNPVQEKTELVFALSETPKYWTEGGNLIIGCNNFKGEVSIDNVKQITFAKAVPTVSSVIDNVAENVTVYPNPAIETISVRGVNKTQSVTLSDISGRLLNVDMDQEDGEISINVSALTPSTYMLKVDGQTFKFVKK